MISQGLSMGSTWSQSRQGSEELGELQRGVSEPLQELRGAWGFCIPGGRRGPMILAPRLNLAPKALCSLVADRQEAETSGLKQEDCAEAEIHIGECPVQGTRIHSKSLSLPKSM